MDYWMMGLYGHFSAFLTASWVVLLAGYTAVTAGYLLSVAAGETTLALSIAAPILIPLMLFSGYFLNADKIPDYLKWLEYMSWFRHASQLLMVNQWDDLGKIPCPEPHEIPENATLPEMCAALNCPYIDGKAVLAYNTIDPDDQTANTLYLIGLTILFFISAFVALYLRARRSRQ
ncbi:ABC transmembrane transporter white [Elysia marginata]|uniref:ABC transmembrane transporter white n=1 Tax=Elysia marginata TaxID=1093978 RepID=A0AAV4HVH5_9GAST|nr:ABC transmembrane transporter white [Elysia marginata]